MTTLAQLKKISKDDLIPFMKDQGFKIVNTFTFLKEGPEGIFYVIYPEISYGENLKVIVVCHTPEMQELIATEFPKFVSSMVGGKLEPGRPIAYESGHIWKVGTEDEAKQALREVKNCIEESALPFFEGISDRQKLVDFIYPSLRRGEYARVIERILAWRPS